MTQAKKVAKSLKDLVDNPVLQTIQDRTKNISSIFEEVKGYWNYDIYSRKPGPAYTDDGVFVGTDLDLACFLYSLQGRNAVINIPEYETFRQTKFKEGQMLTSKDNRHGKIVGVVANQHNFTFSVRIIDTNVMTSSNTGDYRNFAMTGFDGNWYKGWKTIQLLPSVEENKFITENKLWSGDKIIFKNFVHPNRWTSFFGQYYFTTKLLIDRLVEERKHLNSIKKRMLNEGINYPLREGGSPSSYVREDIDKGKQIKVKSFNVEVDFVERTGEYSNYENSQDDLILVSNLWSDYGKVITNLRFMTRATELAHYNNPQRMPGWLKNVKWESGYVLKGKRIEWDRLVLYQPGVGKQGVSIRKRSFEKAERVSENFQEA